MLVTIQYKVPFYGKRRDVERSLTFLNRRVSAAMHHPLQAEIVSVEKMEVASPDTQQGV